MLTSKVERMVFTRLNRHLVDEVHELDAANAQARAKVAKSAQKSATAQQERSSMSVDFALKMSRMACEWYPLSACPCVSCFVAVLGFTLVLILINQVIRLLLWF